MVKMEEYTEEEKRILVFLETCLVDRDGKFQSVKMNKDDWVIAEKFKREFLIDFGRLSSESILSKTYQQFPNTHWVRFSERAWEITHGFRREMAERCVETVKGE